MAIFKLTGAFDTKEYVVTDDFLNARTIRKITRDGKGVTRITVAIRERQSMLLGTFAGSSETYDILCVTETPDQVLQMIGVDSVTVATPNEIYAKEEITENGVLKPGMIAPDLHDLVHRSTYTNGNTEPQG